MEDTKDLLLEKIENMNFEDLYKEVKGLLKSNQNLFEIKSNIDIIADKFQNMMKEDVVSKKETFVNSGEDEINFMYNNPIVKEFNDLIKQYKSDLVDLKKKIDKEEKNNLVIKENLIERLKNVIDEGKAPNEVIKEFKEIKEKWVNCGRIPSNKVRIVTNTFLHHQRRFYDYLDLNREYRDIEYAKNLEEKKNLIERLRKLSVSEKDIEKSFYELKQIQRVWREDIGPVPKESKDSILDEFNQVASRIEEKYLGQKKDVLEIEKQNLVKKKEILTEVNSIFSKLSNLSKHIDFLKTFDRLEELKTQFIELGNVPLLEKNKLWKEFRSQQKDIITFKNSYFKEFRSQQKGSEDNKKELINRVESLLNSEIENWEDTKDLVIKLQKDWKSIGNISKKRDDELWNKFSEKCNLFFDRYKEYKGGEVELLDENYLKKEEYLQKLKIEKDNILSSENILDKIQTIFEEWRELGKVRREKFDIENIFNDFLEDILKEKGIKKQEITLFKIKNKVKNLLEDGDGKALKDEYFTIKRKLSLLEKDIVKLENNISLFKNVSPDENKNPMLVSIIKKIERLKSDKELLEYKEKYMIAILNGLNEKNK